MMLKLPCKWLAIALLAAIVAIAAIHVRWWSYSGLWTAEIRFDCAGLATDEKGLAAAACQQDGIVPRSVVIDRVEKCFAAPFLRKDVARRAADELRGRVPLTNIWEVVNSSCMRVSDGRVPVFTVSSSSHHKDVAACVACAYFNAIAAYDQAVLNDQNLGAHKQLMTNVASLRRDVEKIDACIREIKASGREIPDALVARRKLATDALSELECNMRLLSDQNGRAARMRQVGNLMVTMDADK